MLDNNLLNKINEVVNYKIRPMLQMDGGDIVILAFNNNVLSVKLQGACATCPRAMETLKFGVESTLRQLVSSDIQVQAV